MAQDWRVKYGLVPHQQSSTDWRVKYGLISNSKTTPAVQPTGLSQWSNKMFTRLKQQGIAPAYGVSTSNGEPALQEMHTGVRIPKSQFTTELARIYQQKTGQPTQRQPVQQSAQWPTRPGEYAPVNPITGRPDLSRAYSGVRRNPYDIPTSEAVQYASSNQQPLAYKREQPNYGGATISEANPKYGGAVIREVRPTIGGTSQRGQVSSNPDPKAISILNSAINTNSLKDINKQSLYDLGHRAGLATYQIDDLLRNEQEKITYKRASTAGKLGLKAKKIAGGFFPGFVYGNKQANEMSGNPLTGMFWTGRLAKNASSRQKKWYQEVYLPAKRAGYSTGELYGLFRSSPDVSSAKQQATQVAFMASTSMKGVTESDMARFISERNIKNLTRQDLLDVPRGIARKEVVDAYIGSGG